MIADDEDETVPVKRTAQIVAAVMLFVAWIVAYIDRIVIGTAIIPMARDFRLDSTEKGYVLGAFYLSYAFMQLGGGALTDRFGPRRTLIGCLAAWSVFTIFTGLAWSLPALLLARILFGIGEGSFSPASASAISTFFPRTARASLQSLMGSTGFLGSAVGAAATAWVVATFGWRQAFLWLGAAGLLVVIGFALTLPRAPVAAVSRDADDRPTWRQVAGSPGLGLTASLWFCACIAWLGVQSWMPSYLAESRHVSIVQIGLYLVFPGVAGFLSMNVAGRLIDRQDGHLARAVFLVSTAAIPVCLVLFPHVGSTAALIALWSVYAAGFGPLNATVLSFAVKHVPRAAVGRAMGIINFCGQIAGTLTSVIVGWLVSLAGGDYGLAFWFLAAVGAGGFVLALVLSRRRPATD